MDICFGRSVPGKGGVMDYKTKYGGNRTLAKQAISDARKNINDEQKAKCARQQKRLDAIPMKTMIAQIIWMHSIREYCNKMDLNLSQVYARLGKKFKNQREKGGLWMPVLIRAHFDMEDPFVSEVVEDVHDIPLDEDTLNNDWEHEDYQ